MLQNELLYLHNQLAENNDYSDYNENKIISIEKTIDNLGFRQIHCCNTLPINEGGLSGKSLIPYVNNLISIIREKWGNEILIIAGGGVTNQDDIKNYLSRGANHISLGTICFKPWKIKNLINESI